MSLPRLQAILDVDAAQAAGWAAPDLLAALLDGGALCIQIRAKQLASGPLLALCERAVRAAAPYRAAIIVHDRPDLAVLAGAAGVHVGQDDLAPAAARRLMGADAIVGYSTHTIQQLQAAMLEPVSYIAVGPVFGTQTKDTGHDAIGLDFVAMAARLAAPLPIVAIGGITLENARSVIDAGAAAVAVISDLLVDTDVARRTQAYLQNLA